MSIHDLLKLKEKIMLLTRRFTEFHVRAQTHHEACIALANIGAYAFSTSWTTVQVLAVKRGAIFPSPNAITKTHGTNAVTIVKTAIWAAHYWNRYKKRNVKFLKHTIRYIHIPITHLICSTKCCISIVFNFSLEGFNTQEKWKTKIMQKFEGQIRCIMENVEVEYWYSSVRTQIVIVLNSLYKVFVS